MSPSTCILLSCIFDVVCGLQEDTAAGRSGTSPDDPGRNGTARATGKDRAPSTIVHGGVEASVGSPCVNCMEFSIFATEALKLRANPLDTDAIFGLLRRV